MDSVKNPNGQKFLILETNENFKISWAGSEREVGIWEDTDPITVDLYGDC